VTTTAFHDLTPDSCIQAMEAFWREQVEAAYTRDGIALTLPLMYSDGWQVTVHIMTTTPGRARLSDYGKTLGSLVEAGMKLDATLTALLLEERMQMFEVQQDGFLLTKDVQLPLQGVDVQIFAEALVSIAHLIYRREGSSSLVSPADRVIGELFEGRKIKPRRRVPLEGLLEKRILIDYVVEARRLLALEVVHRRDNLLPYMEQWAFRWDDLRKKDKRLMAAMVYDPEHQEWDSTALRIGQKVCDVFCRYDEIADLNRALDEIAA